MFLRRFRRGNPEENHIFLVSLKIRHTRSHEKPRHFLFLPCPWREARFRDSGSHIEIQFLESEVQEVFAPAHPTWVPALVAEAKELVAVHNPHLGGGFPGPLLG